METKLQTFPSITFIKAMIITVHIRNSLSFWRKWQCLSPKPRTIRITILGHVNRLLVLFSEYQYFSKLPKWFCCAARNLWLGLPYYFREMNTGVQKYNLHTINNKILSLQFSFAYSIASYKWGEIKPSVHSCLSSFAQINVLRFIHVFFVSIVLPFYC